MKYYLRGGTAIKCYYFHDYSPVVYCSQTGFQGVAPIDPSSLEFPRGGDERANGVYGVYMSIAREETFDADKFVGNEFRNCSVFCCKPEGREAGSAA